MGIFNNNDDNKRKKKKSKTPEGYWEPLIDTAVTGAAVAMVTRSAAHIADVWWTCNQLYTDACESLPVLYTDAVTIIGMGAYLTYTAKKHYDRNVKRAARYGELYVGRTFPERGKPSEYDFPDRYDRIGIRPRLSEDETIIREPRRYRSPRREYKDIDIEIEKDDDLSDENDFLREAKVRGLGRYKKN